jgi:hypothetical protein
MFQHFLLRVESKPRILHRRRRRVDTFQQIRLLLNLGQFTVEKAGASAPTTADTYDDGRACRSDMFPLDHCLTDHARTGDTSRRESRFERQLPFVSFRKFGESIQ